MTTAQLWQSSDASRIAELQWRFSLVLLAPILTLMAVPLSRVSPRQGRFAKLVPAVLLYILYFGLLLTSCDLVAENRLSPVIGVWWVHLLFTAVGWFLFTEKHLALSLPRRSHA